VPKDWRLAYPYLDMWRRVCFVEERGLSEELTDATYANGTRPLQMSQDHYLPKSHWPEDGRTHDVHLYCQNVQGGTISAGVAGRASSAVSGSREKGLAKGRATQAATGYPNLEKGLATNKANGFPNLTNGFQSDNTRAAKAGAKGNCQRININQGKPCVCGQHD
jgi:hypothetical protein